MTRPLQTKIGEDVKKLEDKFDGDENGTEAKAKAINSGDIKQVKDYGDVKTWSELEPQTKSERK